MVNVCLATLTYLFEKANISVEIVQNCKCLKK